MRKVIQQSKWKWTWIINNHYVNKNGTRYITMIYEIGIKIILTRVTM